MLSYLARERTGIVLAKIRWKVPGSPNSTSPATFEPGSRDLSGRGVRGKSQSSHTLISHFVDGFSRRATYIPEGRVDAKDHPVKIRYTLRPSVKCHRIKWKWKCTLVARNWFSSEEESWEGANRNLSLENKKPNKRFHSFCFTLSRLLWDADNS